MFASPVVADYHRRAHVPTTMIAMLECLLLPERASKEGKTLSDMANELVEIGLFDLKEAEE